jgi:hypothetical protein
MRVTGMSTTWSQSETVPEHSAGGNHRMLGVSRSREVKKEKIKVSSKSMQKQVITHYLETLRGTCFIMSSLALCPRLKLNEFPDSGVCHADKENWNIVS